MAVRQFSSRKSDAAGKRSHLVPLTIAVLGLAVLFGAQQAALRDNLRSRSMVGSVVGSPTPPPVTPLAPGRQLYYISGNQPGPKMSEFVIDPLDVTPGAPQTVEVSAGYENGIERITVAIETDTKSAPHELALLSGTAANGKWGGAWVMQEDTYVRNYRAVVSALGADGKSSTVTVTFR